MDNLTLTQEVKPPDTSKGPVRWLKDNLFSTWYNIILTGLALVFLFLVFRGVFKWVFTQANWQVIPANLQILLMGSYPLEQIWRISTVMYGLVVLLGLSVGIWNGATRQITIAIGCIGTIIILLPSSILERVLIATVLIAVCFSLGRNRDKWKPWIRVDRVLSFPWIRRIMIAIGCIGAIIILLPFYMSIREYAFIATVLIVVCFSLGRNRDKWKPWVLVSWVLSFPWTMLILHGFGASSVPTTNWGGLLLTLILAAVGILACFPLGVLLALGRRSQLPAIRWVSIIYIETIRGVPLITILFMGSILLPIFMPGDFQLDKVIRAMIGLTLFSAAYMAENVRGGLQAIPQGQVEAAQAVGLTYPKTMLFIVLPQALRSVIPAIVGQFIALFKDTSLVTIVGLLDLLGIAKSVIANPEWQGLQAEVFLFAALIYFVFTYAMSFASRKVEASLGVGKH